MLYTELGRTGLRVSRLGLGLAALGRPGYINLGHADDLGRDYDPAAMKARCHAVLDAAWAAGVRYFDAARSYGRAEEFLGDWLRDRGIGPGDVTVGSKWGYTYTAGWQVHAAKHEVKEHTLPVLCRQYRESRDLLGPYLKLYQIHSATLDSGVLDDAGVLSELAGRKAEGLRIGLSLSGPGQADTLRRALTVTVDGRQLFDTVQATWNLLEPSAGPALREAHDAGLGVIVKEALANGRLTERNTETGFAQHWAGLHPPQTASPDVLALAAVLAQPWADVALSGAARADHLRSNLAAIDIKLDVSIVNNLAAFAEPPEVYWRTRGGLGWN